MLHLIMVFLISFSTVFAEKLYVVERERGSLAVIQDGKFEGEIRDLGNLNHAIVKTDGDYSYVISRNGYFSKVDNRSDRVVRKIKPGNSGIGFTFVGDYIAIAHYDPKKVTILTKDLDKYIVVETGSRNVGIKVYYPYLVFSLMDKDQIWVLNADKGFELETVIDNVGKLPFDALIDGDRYIVGFFKEKGVGILDLSNFKYRKVKFRSDKDQEVVFKIPHFGMWGIVDERAIIPSVGERKAYVVNIKSMKVEKSIDLIGLPVFISVSPDRRFAVVNYSGDKEDYITVIDLKDFKPVKNIKAGKRVMHLRFSKDGKRLYISSYFENRLKIFDTDNFRIIKEITVPTPSGIFIVR
ncbi:MAG TPA: NirF protein [Persephonella sp.]|uniref:Heme d1 biosynthesis protein NirF n=1 Tax=Persephonella marina (strain DSM 14350 / EX-H1) TaxID=123214 RepID=C0QTT7_PERMH|nr:MULTISPECIES: cytochrome D1 domain-containing protein [Persephonella]ACO03006.1 heme d1 biosynthesis protein NirF [Persephonella marina EX-H1]HCB70280.1 NirF protein [Persephonella sp.]